MKFWLTLLVVAALAVAGVFFWWRPARADEFGPMYRTATSKRGDIVQIVTATGQLSPLTTVEVGSQVSGRIAERYVDFNDKVKTGQLLAEIDPSTYEARVVQAEAELDSARANYDLKKVNADRAAELRKGNIISQSDYDVAMAELRQQEAAVRIREAALQNARLDLERTRIYAPIDGVVISRDVDIGQTVQASFQAPKLFSIAQDLRQMEISASVSEADIGGIEPGQRVEFDVDAFPERKFHGTVRQVRANPTVNQNVVMYPTIITVNNDNLDLLPGMTANVRITTAHRSGVVIVPNSALRFKPPADAPVRVAEKKSGTNAGAEAAPAGLTVDEIPELAAVPEQFRQRAFERHDADKNGRLDETEVAALRESLERFARAAGPDAASGGGTPGMVQRRTRTANPPRTLYVVADAPADGGPASAELVAHTVTLGITDGANTEIESGLEADAVLAVGIIDADSPEAAAQQSNPFMPQMGRRRR